jgi:hypothetical protein
MWPGQRTIAGTRKAPSQLVSFSLRNGVVAASGQVVERLLQFADVAVVLDHAVGIFVARHPALPAHRLAGMGEDVHAGGVHPDEERLLGLDLPTHVVDGGCGRLVVDRLHPLAV